VPARDRRRARPPRAAASRRAKPVTLRTRPHARHDRRVLAVDIGNSETVVGLLHRRTVRITVVITPTEPLNERVKLSLVLGLALAAPFVFYRIWQFIVPGLFKKERSLILPMARVSMVRCGLGTLAAYFYLGPLVVQVLMGVVTPSMRADIRLTSITGFLYNMALACGLVCQLPLVTMALTALGLVTPGFLLRQWRIAIVAVFFITAVITPGDIVTAQVIMAVPMTLLYFLSVGLSWLVARRRTRDEQEHEALPAPAPPPLDGGTHA